MGCGLSKGGVLSRGAVAPAPDEPGQQAGDESGQPGGPTKRRGSVSAEPTGVSHALSQAAGRQSVANQKALGTRERIRAIVKSTLLFKGLDEEQQGRVIDAMEERRVAAGEVVIKQGEEGDNFYVVESGRFRATKGGAEVAAYDGAGSFGELALMYNCPRAATVTGVSPLIVCNCPGAATVTALSGGVLWALDRGTFRALVVGSMAERAQRYQASLKRIPTLQHLTQEQLAAIADCLEQETFEPGEFILWEGAPLDDGAKFYMIESGRVDCFRTFEGHKRAVKGLKAGDVFGEVALLTKAPRQADCVAATPCKCLTLSRAAFERLMGPVEQVLARQIEQYQASNAQMTAGITTAGASSGLPSPREEATATEDASTTANKEAATAGPQPSSPASGKPPARRPGGPGSPAATGASPAASGSAAALLPGSPRPSMLSEGSGSGSFSRKRSSPRATSGSLGARSARSTTNSDGAPGGEGDSPLGAAASGGSSGAAAQLQAALDEAAALAEAEPVCILPPIAEEPAEGATPRTSNASTQSLPGKPAGGKDRRSTAGSTGSRGGQGAADRRESGSGSKSEGAGSSKSAGKGTGVKAKPRTSGSKKK